MSVDLFNVLVRPGSKSKHRITNEEMGVRVDYIQNKYGGDTTTGALLGLDSINQALCISLLSIVLLCILDLLGRLGSGSVEDWLLSCRYGVKLVLIM